MELVVVDLHQPELAVAFIRLSCQAAAVTVEYLRLQRGRLDGGDVQALRMADALAEQLRARLELVSELINGAHVHGASSSKIQIIVSEILRRDLGFREEVVLTPQDGLVTRSRPDFFYSLGVGRGIIAEVERGGTVTNNHDLKDLWKAHIAPDAQHLFLVVPVSNWNSAGRARERPFMRVSHRLQAFFGEPRREVDVVSCHVFGYGLATLEGPLRL